MEEGKWEIQVCRDEYNGSKRETGNVLRNTTGTSEEDREKTNKAAELQQAHISPSNLMKPLTSQAQLCLT